RLGAARAEAGHALLLPERVRAEPPAQPADQAPRPRAADGDVDRHLVEAVVPALGGAIVGGLEQGAAVVVVDEVAGGAVVGHRGVDAQRAGGRPASRGRAGAERAAAGGGAHLGAAPFARDQVDDAADGLAAELDGGSATPDLDALQPVDRN